MIWHPEFASYMVEATPGGPYGGRLHDFLKVEPNMRRRWDITTACSCICSPLLQTLAGSQSAGSKSDAHVIDLLPSVWCQSTHWVDGVTWLDWAVPLSLLQSTHRSQALGKTWLTLLSSPDLSPVTRDRCSFPMRQSISTQDSQR